MLHGMWLQCESLQVPLLQPLSVSIPFVIVTSVYSTALAVPSSESFSGTLPTETLEDYIWHGPTSTAHGTAFAASHASLYGSIGTIVDIITNHITTNAAAHASPIGSIGTSIGTNPGYFGCVC